MKARAWLGLLAWIALASPCAARSHVRPLFEPTDLEFDAPGTIDFDLQFGLMRSQGPWRIVVPDAEIDFGLLPNLELSVAGGYAVEGPEQGPFAFDHSVPSSLWTALKFGALDIRSADGQAACALGTALGPKLPVPSQRGVGVEGLLLLGLMRTRTHAVLNIGGFVDPRWVGGTRPSGLEAGLDLARDLDDAGRFALVGEIAGVRSFSGDLPQLTISGGGAYSPQPWLDLSLMVVGGVLSGSDRYGLLFGVSPKIFAWK
ncbi:MAG: hypothetical protein QM756_37240 [Polyangiaceae bacterium]